VLWRIIGHSAISTIHIRHDLHMKTILTIFLSLLSVNLAFADISLSKGTGSFEFRETKLTKTRPITVWYHWPEKLKSNSNILFVMHGLKRNGQEYRDAWIKHSEKRSFLLLVPEFSKKHYPGSSKYNLGNVFNSEGKLNPKEQCSYCAIDDICKQVREKLNLSKEKYYIYGHSAGAQFVHRMLFFCPRAKVKCAISANAGWYTFPNTNIDFPYGLCGVKNPEELLLQSFKKRMVILLGSEDNDPNHKYLRRTEKANRQGKHRLERGKNFFSAAKDASEKLRTQLNWKLQIVEGVGHSNKKMAETASKLVK
jgi:hypothetical protein